MKGRFAFPDSFVLIFTLIVLAQLATYLLPPGAYERESTQKPLGGEMRVALPAGESLKVNGQPLPGTSGVTVSIPGAATRGTETRKVKPGTYHRVEAERLPWHAALTRIPRGMEKAAEIIFFVLIVGGVIAVVRRTGAIDALIEKAIGNFAGSPVLLTGGMITLFAVGASTIGMAEEYMPFVPILVAMCIALKMDAIVALGIVYIGTGFGYACAALNPFTIMIAKSIAEQPTHIWFWQRWLLLAVMIVIGTHHLLAYARRIQIDPTASFVGDVDYLDGFQRPESVELTPARICVLLLFVLTIGVFIWGTMRHEWYLVELAALFLGLALISAVIGRISPNEVSRSFISGASELTGTAILIGLARTIEVLLSEGRVIDTVIHGIAGGLGAMDGLGAVAPVFTAWAMLGVQGLANLLIPSGSGQAYVTMPIMAPLADVTGIGRETAILAYQFGDGLTNMIIPTNAVLMGMLALARIPYQRWARFIVPLIAKGFVVALLVLAWTATVGV